LIINFFLCSAEMPDWGRSSCGSWMKRMHIREESMCTLRAYIYIYIPDSTGHLLNIQTWFRFQSGLNVHGLSTNVLKTYVIQRTQSMFTFGHLKNFYLIQKIFHANFLSRSRVIYLFINPLELKLALEKKSRIDKLV